MNSGKINVRRDAREQTRIVTCGTCFQSFYPPGAALQCARHYAEKHPHPKGVAK